MAGVYIKGRKLPNSCDDCWVSDCPNDEHIDGYRMTDRPTYCPLVPVPDHGRLIDADALIADYNKLPNRHDSGMVGKVSNEELYDAIILDLEREPVIISVDKEG